MINHSKHVETINDVIVKAIPNFSRKRMDERMHLSYKVLNDPYSNVAIFAPKNSGKTCALFTLVKQMVNKGCKAVIFFVSTLYNDKSYADIRAWLDMKGVPYVEYDSIFHEENGSDQLLKIINDLKNDAKKREMEHKTAIKKAKAKEQRYDELEHQPFAVYDNPEENQKEKLSKYIVPEYVFVIDDLSEELQTRSVKIILKKNRHFLCSVIISTQANIDMLPSQKKQIDTWLIFKAEEDEKLLTIYKNADIGRSVPFAYFKWMYKEATTPKYGFLYINAKNDDFRMNFDKRFKIPKNVFKLKESDYSNDQEGEGILDTVKEAGKRVIDFVKGKREGAGPALRKFLQTYGRSRIVSINICRTPVNSVVQKALNVITFGKFEEAKKLMKFDDMYHLFLFMKLERNDTYRVDKNEVVTVVKNSPPQDGDCMIVNLGNKDVQIDQFFDNTIKKYGSNHVFQYNVKTANCQVFISNMLTANGLNTQALNKFIMQDVVTLFSKLPAFAEKIATAVTDTAARLDILRNGKGKNRKGNGKMTIQPMPIKKAYV